MNSHERISNKNPAGLKTDSVHSKHSLDRGGGGGDPRSSTSTSTTRTERSKTPSKDSSTPACRDRDWHSVKLSIRGFWRSVIRVGV